MHLRLYIPSQAIGISYYCNQRKKHKNLKMHEYARLCPVKNLYSCLMFIRKMGLKPRASSTALY
jgi:hypothetical protein